MPPRLVRRAFLSRPAEPFCAAVSGRRLNFAGVMRPFSTTRAAAHGGHGHHHGSPEEHNEAAKHRITWIGVGVNVYRQDFGPELAERL